MNFFPAQEVTQAKYVKVVVFACVESAHAPLSVNRNQTNATRETSVSVAITVVTTTNQKYVVVSNYIKIYQNRKQI